MSRIEIINLVPGIPNDRKHYSVCALKIDGDCDYLASKEDILQNHPKSESQFAGFQEWFDQISLNPNGPRDLFKKRGKCEEIRDGIYRFRKGDYRIYWFYAKGKIVVCSHAIVKPKQQVSQKDIEKALQLKSLYQKYIEGKS